MEEQTQESLLTATNTGNSPETATQWYGDENKELVETKGWKSADDAVKSYTELEKSMGSRVKLPTPESSAEEINAFYAKTGRPENPDGYEIKTPEGSEAFRNEGVEEVLKGIAFEKGVSKEGFESIVSAYYDKMAQDLAQGREAGMNELKQEFGSKYDENIAIAQRFCETCSPEFKDLMETTGLGNNAIIIREFISKGQQTMSDTMIKGEANGDKETAYVPQYATSPDMYRNGDGEESKKARAYFESQGHKY